MSPPPGNFEPSDWPRFVQLDPFARDWARLGLGDDDLRGLELLLISQGDRAPVIRGTGGLRKIRLSREGSNRGKRDSYRVCFVRFPDFGIVLLVSLYGKDEESDLNAADRAAIASVIESIRERLERGAIR